MTKRRTKTATKKAATAKEFDRLHDAGVDISAYMDDSQARRPGRETFKVNVDFPLDLLARIDREAARIGVPRQSWIKMRLADVLGRDEETP